MAKQNPAPPKRWWIVAAVMGITIITAAQLMKPSASPDSIQSVADQSSAELCIIPKSPLTFHALRVEGALLRAAQPGGFENAVSGAARTNIVWSVDGREVHRGPELNPKFFRKGSVVEARVQEVLPDGSATIQGRAMVHIGDARPQIKSVTVQRDPQDPRWLQAHVQAVDADDDPLTLEYRWSCNGKAVRRTQGSRACTDGIDSGQHMQVEVIAFDGQLRSDPLTSRAVAIDNHPPELMAPQTPRMERLDNGDLVAHMVVRGRDPDGDDTEVALVEAPAGFRWDAVEQALVWTILNGKEVVDVTLRVKDARGASAQRTMSVRR